MNFFRSVFGTCCGPHVFLELRKHSIGKTLGHLFLLCFLCAVLIGVGNYYLLKYRWRATESGFCEIYGTMIYLNKKGISPDKLPDVSRRQELPYNGLLIYVSPNGPEKNYPDETLVDRNFIVLWGQGSLSAAFRSGKVWNWQSRMSDGAVKVLNTLTFSEMKQQLFAAASLKPVDNWNLGDNIVDETMSSRQLFKLMRLGFSIYKGVEYFFRTLIAVLFCTIFFTVIQGLIMWIKLHEKSFGAIWKVFVYVFFPVIIIASAFPALQLPGTHLFDEMLILGWGIYLFFVVRYLRVFSESNSDTQGTGSDE